MSGTPHQRRSAWPLIVGFTVLAVLIGAAGYWAWWQQSQSMRSQAERSLVAVGDLKAGQITAWLKERRGDAEMIRGNPLISAAVADLIARRDVAKSRADLQAVLDAFRRTYGYLELVMTTPEGAVLLRSPRAASGPPLDTEARALVQNVAKTGHVESSDLHLSASGRAALDFVAPIPGAPTGRSIAVVNLAVDPGRFLYPLIRIWPLPSRTGETLLVERRGSRVVYLNDLRFRENAALKLTTPLDTPNRPAAMAARGQRGIAQGIDYRGVPVLSAIRPVPSTPWFIVAKEDTGEILGPIRTRGWFTAGFTLLLVALAGIGTLYLWRARETQASAEILESEERYRALVEHAPMAIFVNREDRVVLANEACLRLFGATTPEQLLGKSPFELFHPECHQGMRERIHRLRDEGEQVPQIEERIVRLDGSAVDVEVAAAPFKDQGVNAIHVVLNDITERKRAEAELRETRDYLENLFGYANAPVIVWDPELRITRFNRAFEELTQRSADEVIGRHLELLFPEDERRKQALEHVTEASAGERWQVVEIPILRADGEVRTVLWNSATVYAADGVMPVATIAQGQDITERVQAEDELRASERKFRETIQALDEGYYSVTLDATLLDHNPAFNRILGIDPKADLRGRPSPDFWWDPADRAAYLEQLNRDGVIHDYLVKAKAADGTLLILLASAHLVRDERGEVARIDGSIVDFTTHQRVEDELRESEERLRFLIDQTPTVTWMTDRDLRFTLSRGEGLQALGLGPDQVVGMSVSDFLKGPGPQADLGVAMHRRALAGESFVYEQPVGDLTFDIVLGPLRETDDTIAGVISVAYDITTRKQADEARRKAESELAALNVELEQRVLDRTSQLDAANKELEAFAYSVSHDLRAPLRHISGFSALLAERVGDGLDEKSSHYVDTISRSVREMGVLIDDLLQFSRTGRAEMTIEPVDMDATVAEALEPLRRETAERDIEWTIGRLPAVIGDHALLRQVWANLLGNAVKYSRGRETARIEVGARGGDGADEDVFWVRDNGVGFDMQYAHKLFGVFQRLHSATEFEGTGIGLANVGRIVTRLGGRAWAEGEVDHGATFWFSLPRRKDTAS